MAGVMKVLVISLATIWLESCTPSEAAKILVVMPFPMRSHDLIYKPLFAELALRGHSITEITLYRSESVPKTNYRQIVVQTKHAQVFNSLDIPQQREEAGLWKLAWGDLFLLWELTADIAVDLYENAEVSRIIKSKTERFDLVICEAFFGSESLFAFGEKFGAPTIAVSSLGSTVYMNQHIGNPLLTASYPNFLLPYDDKMSFLQRLHNALLNFYIIVTTKLYHIPNQQRLVDTYFADALAGRYPGGRPSLTEMIKQVALVFINRNPILGFPRPYSPNVIDISGLHLQWIRQNNSPVDSEIGGLMDTSVGVIYFSLGSNVNFTKMAKERRLAFAKALSRLDSYHILWKRDDGQLLPDEAKLLGGRKTILIRKWFPQQQILEHKKCRLFITHGGMLSLEEAAYNSVPVLGIPFFGDQPMNVGRAVDIGFGLQLDYNNVTETSVYWAVWEMLTDSRYKRQAEKVSSILLDQPQTPLDKAVYWVEYILRHEGASHLRTSAVNLTWVQYLLLDVTLLAIVLTAAFLFILRIIFKKCWNSFASTSRTHPIKSKND